MRYRIQEGSFVVPEEWHDLSEVKFQSGTEDGFELSVLKNRKVDHATPREAMADAKIQLADLFAKKFRVLREGERRVAGAPAYAMEYVGETNDGKIYGLTTIVYHRPGQSLVLYATAPEQVWPRYHAAVLKAIESFELAR